MKVNPKSILRYKICKWMQCDGVVLWGIDVLIDGRSYHVKNKKPLFFSEKKDASKYVREENKKLRSKQDALIASLNK
jgi:hypothetical protein